MMERDIQGTSSIRYLLMVVLVIAGITVMNLASQYYYRPISRLAKVHVLVGSPSSFESQEVSIQR